MKIIHTLLFLALFNFGYSQEKFDVASVEKFQKNLNSEYADAKTSPLTVKDLVAFKALDFYPINEKFFVTAKFIRTENENPFERVGRGCFGRRHDHGLEIVEGKFEYLEQQLVLAGKKVIHADGVDAGFSQDGGDARGVVALLVKELKGGSQ